MSSPSGRALLPAGLSVVLALLLAGAAVLAWRVLPWQGADLEPVLLAVDKSLGINAILVDFSAAQDGNAPLAGLDPLDVDEEMLDVQASGLHWLRHRFPWDAMEPSRGSYDWEASDRVVEAAARSGLSLVAVLDGSPTWARAPEDQGNAFAPPVEVRDYGDWVQAFVARYGDVIDHYQIWNEPNIAPHWGNREVDPAAYARLLREGAIRVRAGDPGAVVLAAALAPNVEPGGANMSDLLYLDRLYDAGSAPWFDIVGGQTYPFDLALESLPSAGELSWRRLELLRQVMLEHGDEQTAVWAVSCGVSLAEGVAPATAAVEQARLDWPWLGPMFWTDWSLTGGPGAYGLLPGGTGRRPMQPALQALDGLAGALARAWPGVYPPDHASGQYEGAWRVTPLAADIGRSEDRLAITFRGTRLDLRLQRGDYRAFLFATVDGGPANALPRDESGRSYIVLYDPLHGSESLTVARDLDDGEHVAEFVAEGGWGQWAITGWGVAREAPASPLSGAWLPAVLGLASLSALVAAAWAARAWLAARGPRRSWAAVAAWAAALDERLLLAATAVVALLLYAVPGFFPSLALLAILAMLLLLRPWLGLPLIALALPFYQLGKPFLGKVFSMVEILTLLTAVAGAARMMLDGSASPGIRFRVPRLSTLDWGVAALALLGVLSLLWAEEGRVAARELRTVLLEAALFYALLRGLIHRPAAAWLLADAWLLGATLIAGIGIGQWILGEGVITAEGVWRVRGYYGSPNNLALYLGRAFPLAVALAVFPPARREAGSATALPQARRWIYALVAGLMGVALFLTYSRGAWLVGVPASLIFLAALRGKRTFVLSVVVVLVAVALLLAVAGTERLTSLFETEQGTTFFRLQLWRSSLAMVRDHPLLGVGLDNFLYQYRSHYVLPTAWEEFNLSHPHNLILDFWLRLGLGGLLALGWLLAAFFRRAWQLYRTLPSGAGSFSFLVAGLMAGMVNFVAHGLVDNAFFLVDLAYVFMLMLALVQLTSLARLGPGNDRPPNLAPAIHSTHGGNEGSCVS